MRSPCQASKVGRWTHLRPRSAPTPRKNLRSASLILLLVSVVRRCVPPHPNTHNQDQNQNGLDLHDRHRILLVVCPTAPINRTARRPPTLLRLATVVGSRARGRSITRSSDAPVVGFCSSCCDVGRVGRRGAAFAADAVPAAWGEDGGRVSRRSTLCPYLHQMRRSDRAAQDRDRGSGVLRTVSPQKPWLPTRVPRSVNR